MAQSTELNINENADHAAESFTSALRERTRELMNSLEGNDLASASDLIRQIYLSRDETVYHEVGRLTRALHNALRDFNLDLGLHASAEVEHELSEMVDARSRLSYVIKMTENAANKTMDRVDEAAPLAQSILDDSLALKDEWRAFVSAESKSHEAHEALFNRVDAHLSAVAKNSQGIHSCLTDILMEQGYQDLSGQVIKRVIELVSDVERSLVRLAKIASNVEAVTGIQSQAAVRAEKDEKQRIKAEGPQVSSASRKDVVSGQDDVDELLSSLGF
jgi:chemotaxis protein CheZ